jgi:hypothetical protein
MERELIRHFPNGIIILAASARTTAPLVVQTMPGSGTTLPVFLPVSA